MLNTDKIIQKAKEGSRFHLSLLNWYLSRMIPFNKPHGIRVMEVRNGYIRTSYPYKKGNLNHIRGLHACGLATLSEFTTGLLLLLSLDMKKYRIIMHSMNMEYHYQGKCAATAEFTLSEEWINHTIIDPLKTGDSVLVACEVKTFDEKQNHLTTGKIYWQLKKWERVKTKI